MSVPPCRELESLNPIMRVLYRRLAQAVNNAGLPMHPYEYFRGKARQEDGKKRGVSKAGFGQSVHNYGGAVDFVGKVGGKWSWDKVIPWKEYGKLVRREGLMWGGDFSWGFDGPHADMSTIIPMREFRLGAAADLSIFIKWLDKHDGAPATEVAAEWFEWFTKWWVPNITGCVVRGVHLDVAAEQTLLTNLGFDLGAIDGKLGPLTRGAWGELSLERTGTAAEDLRVLAIECRGSAL